MRDLSCCLPLPYYPIMEKFQNFNVYVNCTTVEAHEWTGATTLVVVEKARQSTKLRALSRFHWKGIHLFFRLIDFHILHN